MSQINQMTEQEVRTPLLQELPDLLEHNSQVRECVWRLMTPHFAPRQETESRFDRMMNELQRMREESDRKWEEHNRKWEENQATINRILASLEESDRKWEENQATINRILAGLEESDRKWEENQATINRILASLEESDRKWEENQATINRILAGLEESDRKWEEHNRKWEENQATINRILEEMKRLDTKINTKIGTIGARWGRSSEESFRNALRGILEDTFKVQVEQVNEFDDEGIVFGHPDFVELDLIIRNGMLLICEIKSSLSKSEVYAFERKVRFYERKHQRQASQMIVISPMVDARARTAIDKLGIQLYSDAEDVVLD